MNLLELLNWAMRTDLVVMSNVCWIGVVILALAGIMGGMSYKKAHRALDEKAKQDADQQPPQGPRPHYFNG